MPQTRGSATAALVSGGENTLPEIRAALERPDTDAILRMRLAQVCGRIGGTAALEL